MDSPANSSCLYDMGRIRPLGQEIGMQVHRLLVTLFSAKTFFASMGHPVESRIGTILLRL